MVKCCSSPTGRVCWGIVGILAALVCLLLAIFVPSLIENILDEQVKGMVLPTQKAKDEDDVGWRQFVDTSKADSNPLYQKFYLWNLTNPHEVLNGSKPNITEVGPYTYRACQRRLNTSFWTDRDGYKQVKFKLYQWYTYEPSMTPRDLDAQKDYITTVNMVFNGMVQMAKEDPTVLNTIWSLYNSFEFVDILFPKRHPEWLFFGGVDPDVPFVSYPGFLHNDTLESVSEDGYTSMYTGEDQLSLTKMLTQWKGFKSIVFWNKLLPFGPPGEWVAPWDTPEANVLHGTMGDGYAPLRTYDKGDSLPTYVDDLHMELPLKNVNNDEVTIKGVHLLKFVVTKKLLQNSTGNPENAPYHMNGPNGFFNLTTPKMAPVFISLPHMLWVDKYVQDMVIGQDPKENEHKIWIGIEPWTGMTLAASKTSQANVPLKPVTVENADQQYIIWFENVTQCFLPLVWMNYGGSMTDDIAKKITGQVYLGLGVMVGMKWGGFALGLFFLIVGVLFLLGAMKLLKAQSYSKSRVISSSNRGRGLYHRASEG